MTSELKKICEDIKRLVPPAIPKDMTGPFETFMKDIKDKVSKEEFNSIHRAYNYFNRLLDSPKVNTIQEPLQTPVHTAMEPKKNEPIENNPKSIEPNSEMIDILVRVADGVFDKNPIESGTALKSDAAEIKIKADEASRIKAAKAEGEEKIKKVLEDRLKKIATQVSKGTLGVPSKKTNS